MCVYDHINVWTWKLAVVLFLVVVNRSKDERVEIARGRVPSFYLISARLPDMVQFKVQFRTFMTLTVHQPMIHLNVLTYSEDLGAF